MSFLRLLLLLLLISTTAPVAIAQSRQGDPPSGLLTRAERSGFTETSRYDDVHRFLATVDEASDLVLVRDIAKGAHADWLQSMVLLVNPVYNADGNERVTLVSRGFQHGPVGGQGTRPNAQGLNINRDNIKLETPEARSMVRLLNDFDPHVMIDLHTTNGSRHAYQLTYETPNNPAVDAAIAREARAWLGRVAQAVKAKDGWDFRSYGNVSGEAPDRVWTTVEDLPRYTHNYWGLRNRFGILSETYSCGSQRRCGTRPRSPPPTASGCRRPTSSRPGRRRCSSACARTACAWSPSPRPGRWRWRSSELRERPSPADTELTRAR